MIEKQKLLILGAGGFARSIADIAEDTQKYHVLGFVVDIPPFVKGSILGGKPIFWIDELEEIEKNCLAICGFGSMQRINIISKVESFGIHFANVIHQNAYVSKTVKMGKGVLINSGVQIASDVILGDHVIVNRGALIGHGVSIKDYSVIAPGVNIAGNVSIGAKSDIGMGTNIIEHVKVGDHCFVGAGSLLTKDIPDRVKVVGIPARIIQENIGDF
jgi:sugar O-acyltransferase (sialic acid O-acetyltransferase NeuD family)